MTPDPILDEPKLDLTAKGIWQQLPTESQKAYNAFTQYLELGPDATLQELADKTGKSLPAIWNFSSRYQWASRATAWRQHFAAINCEAMEKATKKMVDLWAMRQQVLREQNWETFQKLSLWCLQSINKAMSNPQKEVAPYEVRGLLQLASRLGHEAASFETNTPEERDLDSDPVVLEFRANLQKVCEDEIKAEEALAAQSSATAQAQATPPA